MRISDIALSTSTPVGTPRPSAKRPEQGGSSATVVSSGKAEAGTHPDEVAAAKLQKAAGAAHASRVVAAENQRAADSVRGEIDVDRVVHTA